MSEEKTDRFARGDLTPAESRDLAQQALDDPELFDELTSTALARTAWARSRRSRIISPRVAWIVAAAAAVAILAVALYVLRRPSQLAPQTIAVSSGPIFLSQIVDSTTFRGPEPDSRPARAAGSVMQVEGRAVTIDLGSLDGLAKGGEVELVRDGQTTGKLTVTTIFRDHSRGLASPGISVRVKDEVRVPRQMVLRAALDQIDALIARGDSGGARRIAEQVSGEDADPASMSPADWNNLGAIAELHGDKGKAQVAYQRALRDNPPGPARQSIQTNLARVKRSK
jgi:hypothetical protein